MMKHAILSLLTQGPAYGLQVRNELTRRLERERPINVGQVYSTIDRLIRDGYVILEAHTADGLPLYTLTEAGVSLANEWLTLPANDQSQPWNTMVTQVLMARSLPCVDESSLVTSYMTLWQERSNATQSGSSAHVSASHHLASAALSWLQTIREDPSSGYPVMQERPRKGRPKL